MLSFELAQQDIRDRFASNFAQTAIEGGVPMYEELERVDGAIAPYLVYNFADPFPTSSKSIAGPAFDTYMQPVNIYAIAPDMISARKLAMKVLEQFVGFAPTYSGMMTKRAGGGAFAARSTNGAEEAFIVAHSFTYTVQFLVVPQ